MQTPSFATSLLAAASLTASTGVWADAAVPASPDTAGALQEVIVTATKQKESIDKVPISIMALTQDQMDRAGIRSVDDIARQTPGVTFSRSPYGGGMGNNIAIRGITSTTGASTTGVYLDDVPIQSRANQENFIGDAFPEVFDLERVEVLRGPQGTLWGAGAEGGAIRFITPSPGLTIYSGYLRAEVADTEYGAPSYEGGAAVGGPIVTDKLGFRVSAWYRRDGGYVDRVNYETGADYPNSNWQNSYVVHAALAWQPSEAVKVTPSLFYQDIHQNDTGGLWESLSDPARGVFRNGRVLQEPTTDKFYLPSLKIEAALGAVDLTSISSYYYRNEAQLGDDTNFESVIWTGQPYPVLPGQNAPAFIGTAQNIVTQEIRLQSHDRDAPLRWTAGVFYSDAREKDYNYVEDLYLDGIIEQAFGIGLEQFFGTGLADGQYTFVGTTLSYDKQLAGFGQLDYRIWRSLTLTAGLRVARTQFDFVQDFAGPVNYSGSGPTSRTVTGSQGESPVTPKIGLSYNVTANKLVYFSAGEGYRIGGANSPVPLNPACKANLAELGLTSSPLQYHSDKTWSYEVGFKGRSFGDRLQVEASGFHINWDDIQQYVGLPSCGQIGFVSNLGNAVSNGFDLQLNARPVPQLLLSASLGYTHATFSQTVGSNGTTIVDKGDTVGTPPVGFSPWTVEGAIQYDLGRSTGHDVYVRLDDTYGSHQSGRSANLDDPSALGYDTAIPFDPATNELDVRIGTLLGGADISVFANNVLNDHPLLQRTHDIPGSPLYYDLTLRPLTAGVTLSYRY